MLCLKSGGFRIYQMMREEGGYVLVRLYDRQQQAHYLKLDKSIIHHDSGKEYHAKLNGTLGTWPVFLEKALTAFDKAGDFDPTFARYGRTEGGFGDRGLALLTGMKTVRVPIAPPAMDPGTEVGKEVDQVLGVLFSGVDPHDGAALATLRQIFGTSYVQDWADWQKWLKTQGRRDLKSELWGAILGKQKSQVHTIWKRNPYLPDTPSWTTTQGGVFRLEHLQIWFGQLTPPPPVHLSTKVIACARMCRLLAGKRGTGFYAELQIQTFNHMRNLCLAGVPMTVGSRAYVGKTTKEYHYSDEVIKGLVSLHEYAVHNVVSKGNRFCITLINPWGHTGRTLSSGTTTTGKSQPVIESPRLRVRARPGRLHEALQLALPHGRSAANGRVRLLIGPRSAAGPVPPSGDSRRATSASCLGCGRSVSLCPVVVERVQRARPRGGAARRRPARAAGSP